MQLVGKKHIGPKFKSQRILINLFSMYFTKVLQFTPLVTSAFGYRLSDFGTSEVVFHKSPPRTLRGFEDFADNIAAAEIKGFLELTCMLSLFFSWKWDAWNGSFHIATLR